MNFDRKDFAAEHEAQVELAMLGRSAAVVALDAQGVSALLYGRGHL
jgi:hypothetical protein